MICESDSIRIRSIYIASSDSGYLAGPWILILGISPCSLGLVGGRPLRTPSPAPHSADVKGCFFFVVVVFLFEGRRQRLVRVVAWWVPVWWAVWAVRLLGRAVDLTQLGF